MNYGFRLPSALDNRPLRFDEFERIAPQLIFVSATPGPYEKEKSAQIVEQVVRPTGLVDPETEIRPAASQVDDLLGEIRLRVAIRSEVLITMSSKAEAHFVSADNATGLMGPSCDAEQKKTAPGVSTRCQISLGLAA